MTSEKGSPGGFDWSPDRKSIAFTMADPKSDDEEKAEKRRDARVIDEKGNALHSLDLATGCCAIEAVLARAAPDSAVASGGRQEPVDGEGA